MFDLAQILHHMAFLMQLPPHLSRIQICSLLPESNSASLTSKWVSECVNHLLLLIDLTLSRDFADDKVGIVDMDILCALWQSKNLRDDAITITQFQVFFLWLQLMIKGKKSAEHTVTSKDVRDTAAWVSSLTSVLLMSTSSSVIWVLTWSSLLMR